MSDYLLISDAAKEVQVESHVLRYWEEELHLPIKRNELGHRFYTGEDVERFRQIKSLKERGLQLKAIKMILKDGRLDVISGLDQRWQTERSGGGEADAGRPRSADGGAQAGGGSNHLTQEEALSEKNEGFHREDGGETPRMGIEILESRDLQEVSKPEPEERAKRLQWILRQMMQEAVRENNAELCRAIRESVIKELDYQFRMQEERAEEREKENLQRSEEYYRRMDELLRLRSGRKRAEFLRAEGKAARESPAGAENREKESASPKKDRAGGAKEEKGAGAIKKLSENGVLKFLLFHKKQG